MVSTSHIQRKQQILAGFAKKRCVANIIQNDKGEILLLRRSPNDSFHPSTWCLPGGGIDGSESPLLASSRETREEIGRSTGVGDSLHVKTYNLKSVTIFYFFSADNGEEIMLDNVEHSNYQWMAPEVWLKKDLILDLKDHLCTILKIEGFEKN